MHISSINRQLNVTVEGHKMTSAGRLFHTRIAEGKKLHLNALLDPGGTWNLWLWPLVLRVFEMRYDNWSRYCDQSMCYSIHHDGSGSAFLHHIPANLLQVDSWTALSAVGWAYRMLAVRSAPVIHDWPRWSSLYRFKPSILSMLCAVWGHHTVYAMHIQAEDAHNVVHAIALIVFGVRWMKALVEFAFLQTFLTCSL